MRNKRLGKGKLTFRNFTFKSPRETDLWEQTQEVYRMPCTAAWAHSLARGWSPPAPIRASGQTPAVVALWLLHSTVPAGNDIPVLREEAGLRAPHCSPSFCSHRHLGPRTAPALSPACCHTPTCTTDASLRYHSTCDKQTFALLVIFSPTSGGSLTNAWKAELPKMSEHLQKPG